MIGIIDFQGEGLQMTEETWTDYRMQTTNQGFKKKHLKRFLFAQS